MDYSEKVLDHFANPRNSGEMEDASCFGDAGSAQCGDSSRIYLFIDDTGVIRDAKFKTFGCAAAIASSSMATELLKGKTLQEALKLTNQDVCDALDGLPAPKVHCSVMIEDAVRAALWNYSEKTGIVIEGLEKPVPHDHDHEEGEEEY